MQNKTNKKMQASPPIYFSEEKQMPQQNKLSSNKNSPKLNQLQFQLYPQLPNPQFINSKQVQVSGSGIFSEYHTVREISRIISDGKQSNGSKSANDKKNNQLDDENDNEYKNDEDTKDFMTLLNALQQLNITESLQLNQPKIKESDSKKQQAQNKNEPNKKQSKSNAQPEFIKFMKQLNKNQKKQERDRLFQGLSQSQTKSLILGSYFVKVLDCSYSLILKQMPTRYPTSMRIPSEDKRLLLDFMKQLVQQIQLDSSFFSPKTYKWKIQENVKEAISFYNKIQNHFTKNKRKIIKQIINVYSKIDYVHTEAKKILYRNLTAIFNLYKEYKQNQKYNKITNIPRTPKSTKQVHNLFRPNSFVTQSQGYQIEPQLSQNKVTIQSQKQKQKQVYNSDEDENNQKEDRGTNRSYNWEVRSIAMNSQNNYNKDFRKKANKKIPNKNIVIDNQLLQNNTNKLQQQTKNKKKQKLTLKQQYTHSFLGKNQNNDLQQKSLKKLETAQKQVNKKNVLSYHKVQIDLNLNKFGNKQKTFVEKVEVDESYLSDNLSSSQSQNEQQNKQPQFRKKVEQILQPKLVQQQIQIKQFLNKQQKPVNNHSLSISLSLNTSNNSKDQNNSQQQQVKQNTNKILIQKQLVKDVIDYSNKKNSQNKNILLVQKLTGQDNKNEKVGKDFNESNSEKDNESDNDNDNQSDSDSYDSDDSAVMKSHNQTILNISKFIDEKVLKKNANQNKNNANKIYNKQKSDWCSDQQQQYERKTQLRYETPNQQQQSKQKISVSKPQSIYSFGKKQQQPIRHQKIQKIIIKQQVIQKPQIPKSQIIVNKPQPILSNGTNSKVQSLNKQSDSQQQNCILLGLLLKSTIRPNSIVQYEQNMVKYAKSKPAFHIGPRKQMIQFICTISQKVTKIRNKIKQNPNDLSKYNNNEIKKLKECGQKIYNYFTQIKSKQIQQIYQKYYNADYFHIPQRNNMFDSIKQMMKLYKQYN